jgi:UDP-N-acetylmuramate dehydrogenase
VNALAVARRFAPHVRHDEPMARHTSWHAGGPAELWFEPHSADELAAFLRELPEAVPVTFVGLGSNLLVRDGGIRGAVVSLHGTLNALQRVDATRVRAEAGVPCARIARQCVKWQLGPAEFFAGIPGTFGGALAMNAGAWGGETWRQVREVEVINRSGGRHRRRALEYRTAYRSVTAPVAGEWFLAATLEFEPTPGAALDDIRALLERRRDTQPIGEWSCGSVFVNPPGDHAARLIEAAGLKGFRIGDASVSTKHANFIINNGAARAAEIEAVIEHVRTAVERTQGVRLHTEVRIVGEAA